MFEACEGTLIIIGAICVLYIVLGLLAGAYEWWQNRKKADDYDDYDDDWIGR